MPKDFPRAQRVGDQIQRELSELIRDEVRDPRVEMITVTEVIVARDLAHAKVYVSKLGVEGEPTEALEGLNRAAGFLRSQLGKRMRVRTIPQLNFLYDNSFDRAAALSTLIDSVMPHDDEGDEEGED